MEDDHTPVSGDGDNGHDGGRGPGDYRGTPGDAPEGRHYLHRPNELIILANDRGVIQVRLDEIGARQREAITDEDGLRSERLLGLGFERWVLAAPNDDVPDIVERLRRPANRGEDYGGSGEEFEPQVFPNIVVRLHRHAPWHSASGRTPAPPLTALPRGRVPGTGVTVGVLDTGIDGRIPTKKGDPSARLGWFAGRCRTRPGAVDVDPVGPNVLSVDDGHGTPVASIVLRYAPGAIVKLRRFPNDSDELDDIQLSEAIEALAGEGVDIINLSLGAPTHEGTTLPATATTIDRLLAANPCLAIVASAGNANASWPFFPAALKTVFGVGATESDHGEGGPPVRAGFSNFGWWVDCCAPGTDVHGAYLDWPAEGFYGGVLWSGTSFAAPAVCGAIAARMSPKGRRRRIGARQAAFELLGDPNGTRLPELGPFITSRSYAD